MSRLDFATIKTIRDLEADGTPGLVSQLVDLFMQTYSDTMKRIKAGYHDQLARDVREAAHALKSSAAGLGAKELALACQSLETHAKAGTVDEKTMQMIGQIEAEFAKVQADLLRLKNHKLD